jgi:PadR family transcriptional regulator PadR
LDAQLKRGLLEICVLAALRESDAYGYKIIKDISPYIEISESTLYPILKRLELGGSVSEYSVVYNGRLRKYYRLMPLGTDRIRDFLKNWHSVIRAYDFIRGNKEEIDNDKA